MKALIVLATLLSAVTAWSATPCGLTGTVEKRIADCRSAVGPRGEFQLVTRTQKGEEIYKGVRTGVIWSADLKNEKNYLRHNVGAICNKDQPEFGGLKLNWKLPPIHRYIQALKYDIQTSLPGVSKRDYWTSTEDSFYVNSRYIFEGSANYREDSRGNFSVTHLEIEDGYAFVKCIVETIE